MWSSQLAGSMYGTFKGAPFVIVKVISRIKCPWGPVISSIKLTEQPYNVVVYTPKLGRNIVNISSTKQ